MHRLFLPMVVFLLVAGCADPDGARPTPTDTGPPPLVPPNADYGGVEGYALAVDLVPFSNATIRLLDTNLSTTTDSAGYYALLPVPPGDYKLEANATGHVPLTRSVAIGSGLGVRADFTLYPIPNPEPYIDDSFVRNGQIQCTLRVDVKPAGQNTNPSCSDLAKDQTGAYVPPSFGTNTSFGPSLGGLVIEVEWQGSVPALHDKLRLAIRISEAETWRQFEGSSVLRVELGPAELAELSTFAERNYLKDGGLLFFNLYPGEAAASEVLGAGGTFQQDYTMYVTAFYRQAPLPGYSRVASD